MVRRTQIEYVFSVSASAEFFAFNGLFEIALASCAPEWVLLIVFLLVFIRGVEIGRTHFLPRSLGSLFSVSLLGKRYRLSFPLCLNAHADGMALVGDSGRVGCPKYFFRCSTFWPTDFIFCVFRVRVKPAIWPHISVNCVCCCCCSVCLSSRVALKPLNALGHFNGNYRQRELMFTRNTQLGQYGLYLHGVINAKE